MSVRAQGRHSQHTKPTRPRLPRGTDATRVARRPRERLTDIRPVAAPAERAGLVEPTVDPLAQPARNLEDEPLGHAVVFVAVVVRGGLPHRRKSSTADVRAQVQASNKVGGLPLT